MLDGAIIIEVDEGDLIEGTLQLVPPKPRNGHRQDFLDPASINVVDIESAGLRTVPQRTVSFRFENFENDGHLAFLDCFTSGAHMVQCLVDRDKGTRSRGQQIARLSIGITLFLFRHMWEDVLKQLLRASGQLAVFKSKSDFFCDRVRRRLRRAATRTRGFPTRGEEVRRGAVLMFVRPASGIKPATPMPLVYIDGNARALANRADAHIACAFSASARFHTGWTLSGSIGGACAEERR